MCLIIRSELDHRSGKVTLSLALERKRKKADYLEDQNVETYGEVRHTVQALVRDLERGDDALPYQIEWHEYSIKKLANRTALQPAERDTLSALIATVPTEKAPGVALANQIEALRHAAREAFARLKLMQSDRERA